MPMRRKLPARYNLVAMPLALSFLMTFIVSGISTFSGIGFVAGAVEKWLQAWALSWIVAFPTMLFVFPLVRRLVGLVVEPPKA
jgi:hypothetical protein